MRGALPPCGVLLAAAAVALAGCGGHKHPGPGPAPPGPAPPSLVLPGIGTFARACRGGEHAVRFTASRAATVMLQGRADRGAERMHQVDPKRSVRIGFARRLDYAAAKAREPRTEVAWGRLRLGPGCALGAHRLHRGVQDHSDLHARVEAGVSCRRPNSIACDRLALQVELPVPEEGVALRVAGRGVRLRGRPTDEGSIWTGFLHHAGFRGPGPLHVTPDGGPAHWTGRHPLHARVVLGVREIGGTGTSARVRIPIGAGWG